MTKVVGGKIPPKEHAKLKVEDKVDYLLERLIFSKPDSIKGTRKDCLFMPHQMGPMWADTGIHNDLFFDPEALNPKVLWPVSVGMVNHGRNDEWGDHVHCNYWESVPAAKLRGTWRGQGKYNIGWFTGYLHSGGKFTSSVMYAAWHFNKWRNVDYVRYNSAFMDGVKNAGMAPIERVVQKGEDDIGRIAAAGHTAALTYRYEWGAQFSIGGSARVILPTTPRGILELFNDRDKPEDRDRRAALRHWVSQHLRKKAGGDFSKVRSHLRGEMRFTWRGFDVEIRPSEYDAERNAA